MVRVRYRGTIAILWLLLVWFHAHTEAQLSRTDQMLRALLFWSWFLPSVERVVNGLMAQAPPPELIAFYDEDCSFCKKMILVVRACLSLKNVTFRAAQSDPEIFKAMEENNSWVVRDRRGELFFAFTAFIKLLENSNGSWLTPVMRVAPLQGLGNGLYRRVANHRGRLGRWLNLVPGDPLMVVRAGLFTLVLFTLVLFTTVVWNWRASDRRGPTLCGPRVRILLFAVGYENNLNIKCGNDIH